jgi:molecular chaperone GrpE
MEKKNDKINNKSKVKEIKEKKNTPKVKTQDNKLLEENQALNEKILRITADVQNMKRRYDEERERLCKYDGEEVIKKLLPIIDNFERAIKLDDNDLTDEVSKFLSGFKMIYANLLNVLEAMDVHEIDAQDKDFDPKYMEAVLTDKDELYPPNAVLDVLQKGYMYKDKLLRPAMVKVNE